MRNYKQFSADETSRPSTKRARQALDYHVCFVARDSLAMPVERWLAILPSAQTGGWAGVFAGVATMVAAGVAHGLLM